MIHNPLGIYLVMGLLVQMVFLVLDLWGIATLSATMVELIYTPTNSVKAFDFSNPIQHVSWFFNYHHSNWHEMVSQCGFDLHFSNDQWWWPFFHACWLHRCLLLKVSVHILHPLFDGVFFLVNLSKFFVDFRYWPFVRWVDYKNLFPFCWLPVHSNDSFFCCAET